MGGIVSSLGDKWKITCIYVSAGAFVDVAKENERIDSFFVKGAPGVHSADIFATKHKKRPRKGRIETLMAGKPKKQKKAAVPDGIDPEVFASLPEDIRREILESSAASRKSELDARDRSAITNMNDIDPEVFEALPKDVQKEILAAADAQGRSGSVAGRGRGTLHGFWKQK